MDEFNCSYDRLKFDEACVSVTSDNGNSDKWLYSLSADCLSVSTIMICIIFKIQIYL